MSAFREPRFQALLGHIRNADAAFTNLETAIRERHEGFPNLTQGTPMSTPPRLLAELKWMGFNLVSCANNHVTDYGVAGVLAMLALYPAAKGWPVAGVLRATLALST